MSKRQPDRDQSRYGMQGVRTELLIEDAHRTHCGGKLRGGERQGQPCMRSAGWGTSHVGRGYCKLHGGETPAHKANAARLGAILALESLGQPIPTDPIDALLGLVAEAAGNVAFLRAQAAELGVNVTHMLTATKGDYTQELGEEARGIVKLYGEWFDRLARVAKMTVDAGVAEAQVRIAERQADQIARVINRVIASMPLTPEQQDDARRVAADEFRTIAIAAPPAEVSKS